MATPASTRPAVSLLGLRPTDTRITSASMVAGWPFFSTVSTARSPKSSQLLALVSVMTSTPSFLSLRASTATQSLSMVARIDGSASTTVTLLPSLA